VRLTQAEFDEKRTQGTLRLALIGMSNIGKSYTAQRLVRAEGFTCYDVDAAIQAEMGNPNMQEMAKWMGHPYTDGYAKKAAKYLALEAELSLKANTQIGNLILDTTGSVVHIPDTAKQKLKDNFLIVYIKASPADIDILTQRYFKYPKPTIWGDSFQKISGKSNRASLLTCYPHLLKHRAKLYENMADISVQASVLTNQDLKDADILPLLQSCTDKD